MSEQDRLYEQAAGDYGPALARLVRGYEADSEKRRDLLQDIHFALWRSFATFDARCSLRTWVYRVAHNTAISWIVRQKRAGPEISAGLDEIEQLHVPPDADRRVAVDRIAELIRRLRPADREIILLYLEGLDAAEIGDLMSISPANAATKVHRIKKVLAREFNAGVSHAE